MNIWISIIIAGIINYLTRLGSVLLFPAVFLNETNTIVQINDPKIIGFIVSIIIGYFSKSIITTIISGLLSYWLVIFLF